jgi:hypothetical protein
MKKQLLALGLLLISVATSAQNTETVLTDVNPNCQLLHADDNSTTFINYTKRTYGVQLAQASDYSIVNYNNSSNSISSEQDLVDGKSKMFSGILTTVNANNTDLISYFEFNRKEKAIEIYKVEVARDGRKSDEPSLVSSVKVDKFLNYDLDYIQGPHVTDDGSIVYGSLFAGSSSTAAKAFTIKDGENKEFEFNLPAAAEQFKVISQQCDKNGNMFMLGYVSQGDENYRVIDRNKVYLLRIDARSGKLRKMLVNVGANIKTLNMVLSTKNEIVVAGITHLNNVISKGFIIKYSNMLQMVKKEISEVESDAFLTSFTTKSKAMIKSKRENEYFYDYKTPAMIENKDGSFAVFFEQFYNIEITNTSTVNGKTRTYTTYIEIVKGISSLLFGADASLVGNDRVSFTNSKNTESLRDYKARDFVAYTYNGKAALIMLNNSVNDLSDSEDKNISSANEIVRVVQNSSSELVSTTVYELPEALINIVVDFENAKVLDDNSVAVTLKGWDTDKFSKKNVTLNVNKHDNDFISLLLID